MKKKLFKILKTFLPLALGVFFIFYSYFRFSKEQREELLGNISQIPFEWVVLMLAGGLLSHLSRAYRWKMLIQPLGYNLRFSTAFMAVMAGYLVNLGIPRSGEVLRGATAASYDNIPFEKAFGTIIAERAIDVLIVLIIVSLAILLHTQELYLFFDQYHINPWFSLLGMIFLVFLAIGFLIFIKRSKLPIFVRIKKFASGTLQGIKSILHLKKPGLFILHTFFIWGMYILMFYLLKFAFPEMQNLGFSTMLAAFVVGSFSVSITNGGIGIYPIAVGATLALFGISKETGEAFGWVDWGLQTFLSVLLGGLSLLLLPVLNRKQKKTISKQTDLKS